ncbi:zeta toxin family protein [Dyadobacter sp. CY343]|uniref:zeta toxin family protein n=1 Tax=Dyadobacter sp. CY343 TaxID=2907299 RepID=UPI001F018382|nr:zeta toxin family protein [Dyadobacter sp. CY343]MCE7063256.1 zeta toxin family protein [Dyadobacter sp. CY343]
MPELFVITGPNGAGKSVLSKSLLPETVNLPVFDGDKMFYQLLDGFYQELKVSKYAREKAGEALQVTFERLIRDSILVGSDFAYEGHFSEQTSWLTIERFKSAGYRINFTFLSLETVEISLQRVAMRVAQGGHFVSPIHIRHNFYGNIEMLDKHLHLIDRLKIIDNSSHLSRILLKMESGRPIYIRPGMLPPWHTSTAPVLFAKIAKCV